MLRLERSICEGCLFLVLLVKEVGVGFLVFGGDGERVWVGGVGGESSEGGIRSREFWG